MKEKTKEKKFENTTWLHKTPVRQRADRHPAALCNPLFTNHFIPTHVVLNAIQHERKQQKQNTGTKLVVENRSKKPAYEIRITVNNWASNCPPIHPFDSIAGEHEQRQRTDFALQSGLPLAEVDILPLLRTNGNVLWRFKQYALQMALWGVVL